MAVFFTRRGAAAELVGSKMLGDYTESDVVYLNESGSPVAFYVSKHDYESGLNGTGRTLLVRKDCYDTRAWHSSNVNAYASCSLDSWFNGTYKALLDEEVQTAISGTTFYYTPGNGTSTMSTLTRAVFALSVTELGKSDTYANAEGTALPIASTLQTVYRSGSKVVQWTRSAYIISNNLAWCLDTNPNLYSSYCTATYGSRPCFTLPSTAMFDPEANTFISA